MKEIKSPTRIWTRVISFLVAETFLATSILPARALPTDSLRPKFSAEKTSRQLIREFAEARDGGVRTVTVVSYYKLEERLIERITHEALGFRSKILLRTRVDIAVAKAKDGGDRLRAISVPQSAPARHLILPDAAFRSP